MKIKNVTVDGFKGGSWSMDLDAVNLIVGRNFTGKTARLDAVRVGLLGYLPELGKTAGATLELASESSMGVSITFDTGKQIVRSFGKVKRAVACDASVPAVLLDPNVFLALGPKDQVRYVFSNCKVDGLDNGLPIIEAVRAIETASDAERAVLFGIAEDLDRSDDLRHDVGQSVQDWLAGMISATADTLKGDKASVTRLQGAVQAQAQIGGSVAKRVKPDDLKAAQDRVNAADVAVREARNAAADDQRRAERIVGLNRRLAAITTTEADVCATREKLASAKICLPTDDTAAALQKAVADDDSAQAAVANAVGRLKLLSDRKLSASDRLKGLFEQQCCPTCGAANKGWRKRVETALSEELAKAREEFDTVNLAVNEAVALRTITAKARHAAFEADGANTRAKLEVGKLECELERALQALDMRAVLTKELEEAPRPVGASVPTELIIALQDAKSAFEELARADRAWQTVQAEERMREKQIAELDGARATVAVRTKVMAALESAQKAIVDRAMGSVVDKANALCEGILPTPLAYNDGVLGRWSGTTWVPHRTFSGTEKALAYAGLSVALAAQSEFKIVLVDEMGRLDNERKVAVISRAKELVEAGVIDQFIGVSPDDIGGAANVINVA